MFRSSKKLLCCKIIFDNLYQMNKGERTLIVVKPDGIVKKKVGEIIKRIEEGGLDMVGAKFLKTDKDMIEKHYTLDPEWIEKVGKKAISSYEKKGLKPPSNDAKKIGRAVLKNLQKYLTEGPVFMALFEGENAVARVREICGGTEPVTAGKGTIRQDFSDDSYQKADQEGRALRNLIHASGSPEEAEKEIELWFGR